MAMRYSVASEAGLIGKKLIKDFHSHLNGVRVEYLFMDQRDDQDQSIAITSKGRPVYGKTKKVSGLNAYLAATIDDEEEAKPFFVILVTKYTWDLMTPEQKSACVDHYLCHADYDGTTGNASLIDHDVNEFTEIIKRHGIWNDSLDTFFKAGRNLKLPFREEAPAAEPAAPTQLHAVGNGKDAGAGDDGKKSSKKSGKKHRADVTSERVN